MRVTFDKQVRTGMYNTELFNPYIPTIPVFDNNEIVLEVKYDRVMPPHLRDLITTYCPGAMQSAISKYTWCRRYEALEA